MALLKVNWLNAAVLNDITAAETVTGLATLTFQAKVTGSPTSWAVTVEGSIDGSTWEGISNISPGTGGSPHAYHAAFASAAESSGGNGCFMQYVRLHVTTLSGGTSPTVSVSMLAL